LKESKAFYKSIKNVKETQEVKLKSILERNTNALIGQEYNFQDIQDTDSFRNHVPLTTYESYGEYLEKIANGETGILTTEQVLLFEPTSGSTSPMKFIPYTESLRNEFRKGISPWLFDLLHNRPKITNGNFYWSITPVAHQTKVTIGGIEIGFGDDSSYFHPEQQRLLSRLTTVPFKVGQIQDIEEFRYATLLNLLKNKQLSFVSIWNPTFLSLLMRPLQKLADHLIKDINDDGEGRIITRDWSLYDGQHVVFKPKKITKEELLQGHEKVWRESYALKSILRRLLRRMPNLPTVLVANFGYRCYAYNLSRFYTCQGGLI
jgi:hypothetical protein